MSKIAVVLFNLGGPDNLKNVKPFLFNLFNDKAIINLPQPFRYIIAKIISNFRAGKARLNYAKIGNGSPLLSATNSQALALEEVLNKNDNDDSYKVLVCMRYWHPMTEEIIEEIKNGDFEKIILLPLYPQFSVTTSGSSFKKWHEIAKREGVNLPTSEICCYPINKFFINAHVKIIKKTLLEHRESENLSWRILFSAHGLPQNIIDNGDPYQHHVEKTVQEIVKLIDKEWISF
jgi:ferrochelatase